VESESPAHAAARKEQIAIRRERRVQREEIPTTPTLTQLAEHYRQTPQSSYDPGPNSTPIPSPWITGRRRRVTERVQRRYNKQQRLHQANPEHPDQEQPHQEQSSEEQPDQKQPDQEQSSQSNQIKSSRVRHDRMGPTSSSEILFTKILS